MIYIIDHQDSFTYNVVHQFSYFDHTYCSNYFNIDEKKLIESKIIIFSSGPGSPKDYLETSKIYRRFKGKKKIIGICLGFQQILYNESGFIIEQKKIYHGYQSKVRVTNKSLLFKKDQTFLVGRYHSLKLKEPFKSKTINITMRCIKTGVAMAFEDIINNVYGFQFHPESFLTVNGKYIIQKILSFK